MKEKEKGEGNGVGGERQERGGKRGAERNGRGEDRREGTPQIFTWIDAYGSNKLQN